ncbi:hypothetical protein MMC25_000760 [Agyrium rufum]|nr:hypothetical protein [Agyrium rufum]
MQDIRNTRANVATQQMLHNQSQQALMNSQRMMMQNGNRGNGQQQMGQPQFNQNLQNQFPVSMTPQAMGLQQLPPGPMGNMMANGQMAMMQNSNNAPNPQNLQPGCPVNSQGQVTQVNFDRTVNGMARKLQAEFPQAQLPALNKKLADTNPETIQKWTSAGLTPQDAYFRGLAIAQIKKRQAQGVAQQNGIQMNVAANHHQNGMISTPSQMANDGMLNANNQPSGVNNSVSHISAQQLDGFRSQERGQQVVPASSNQAPQPPQQTPHRNPTPQVAQMGLPNGRPPATPTPQQMQGRQMPQPPQQASMANMQRPGGQIPGGPQAPLTGQVGGLGTNGVMVPQQSPAMPTLTQSLDMPGHAPRPNGTPQPRPPQGQAGNPNITAMQGEQPVPLRVPQTPAEMNHIMSRLHPSLQRMVHESPPDKRIQTLMAIIQNVKKGNLHANGIPPMNARPSNMNQIGPGQSSGVMQPGHPAAAHPDRMANPQNVMTTQMRGMPMPNPGQQVHQQQSNGQLTMADLMQTDQMMRHQQINPSQYVLPRNLVQNMDQQIFPSGMLGGKVAQNAMPQGIRSWGELKQWVSSAPELGPEVLAHLERMQFLHFQTLSQRKRQMQNQKIEQIQRNNLINSAPMMQPGLQQTAPPAPMGQIPGQPPVGMQVNPNAPGFPPINLNQIPQPTPQDVQNARLQHPDIAHLPDLEIAKLIWNSKRNNYIKMMRQINPRGLQNAQPPMMNPHDPQQNPGLNRRILELNNQKLQNQLQQNQQMAAMGQPQWPLGIGGPGMQSQPSQKPNFMPQQGHGPAPQNNNLPKNISRQRAGTDEVMEVPNPNLAKQSNAVQKATTASPAVVNQPQHTQSTQRASDPQKSAQEKGAAGQNGKAQNTANPQNGQGQGTTGASTINQPSSNAAEETRLRTEKLKQMQAEISKSIPERKTVNLSPHLYTQMKNELEGKRKLLEKSDEVLQVYFVRLRGDERAVKEQLTAKTVLLRQFQDGNPSGELKASFTMTPQEVSTTIRKVFDFSTKICHEMQRRRDLIQQHGKNGGANAHGTMQQSNLINNQQPPQQPATAAQQNQPQPIVEQAKQQQQQQQLQQPPGQKAPSAPMQRGGSNRNHNKAPAAPTTAHAPFSFNTQSPPPPHGVPTYASPGITQENLRLPPGKRRKKEPAPAAAQKESGSMTPASVAKALPATTAVTYRCPVIGCSSAQAAFASADALRQHTRDAHETKEPVIENPLAWTLESMRIGLGLDEDGNLKVKEGIASAPDMKKSTSAQGGQTPMSVSAKIEAGGTPMSRAPTQGSVDGKFKTPQGGNHKSPASKPSGTTNVSSAAQAPPTPPQDPWEEASISPSALAACFPSLADLQHTIPLQNTLTPSSTASAATPTSSAVKRDGEGNTKDGKRMEGAAGEGEKNIVEDQSLKINLDVFGFDINGVDSAGTFNLGNEQVAAGSGQNDSGTNWLPNEFFSDCLFPPSHDLGMQMQDDDLLGMTWDEAVGKDEFDANLFGDVTGGGGAGTKRKKGLEQVFDDRLFGITI